MPRRPATITQADVARTVRAAMQAGAASVEVRPDGTLLVHLHGPKRDEQPVDAEREIVL